MAFLKEKLSAFLAQPVEKKRSDHRLKKVASTIDPRSWILDEELKRQQFLNVVNNTGDGGGGVKEEGEGRDEHQPAKSLGQRVLEEDNVYQLEDKIKTLEDDKNFLKNVIADKENEIEQLLYRIRAMFEIEPVEVSPNEITVLQSQFNELLQQFNIKDEELKKTKDLLRNTEKMLRDLQALIESTGDDPEKQKAQLDKVMKDLQGGMQDDIEKLESQVKILEENLKNANAEIEELKTDLASANKQIEALASGDDNELNKIIIGLRDELNNAKASKDAENKALKEIIAEKDNELKNMGALKGGQDIMVGYTPGTTSKITDKPVNDQPHILSTDSPEIDHLKSLLSQKNKEINELKNELENEKTQNSTLKDQLKVLADKDESGLANTIVSLTNELENLKRKQLEERETPKPVTTGGFAEPSDDKIDARLKTLESMLNGEKELNEKLKKELQNERDKVEHLLSADDSELKKLLADAERENVTLKLEKENDNKLIKSLNDKIDFLKQQIQELEKQKISPLSPAGQSTLEQIPIQDIPEDIDMLKSEVRNLRTENKRLKDIIKDYDNEGLIPKPGDTSIRKLGAKDKEPVSDEKNIQDLLEKIKQLELENKNLRNQNESLKNIVHDKEKGTTPSSGILPDLDTKISGANEDEISKDHLKREYDRLNNELKSETDSKKILQDKISNLEKENKTLKDELESLQQRYNNLQNQFNELIKGETPSKVILKPSKEKLDDANQLVKPVVQSDQIINDMKNKIKELEEANTKLNKSAKSEKDKCNEDISNKNKDIENLQDDIKRLQKENDLLKKPNDTVIKELIDSNNNFEKENNNLKKDNESLKNELNILKQKQLSPNMQSPGIGKSEKENDFDLKEENDKLKNELKSLKSKIDDYKTQCDQQKAALENENSSLKDKLKSSDSELENLKNKYLKDVKGKEDSTADASYKLANENEKLKKEIKELMDKIKKNDKQSDDQLAAKIKAENEALKEKIKQLELKPKDKEQESIVPQHKEVDKSVASEDVPKLLNDNTNLKANNDKLNNEVKNLNKELENLKSVLKTKTSGLESCEKNSSDILEENKKLKQAISLLEEKMKESKAQVYKTPDQKEKIDFNDMPQLKAENSELVKENKALKNEIEDLKSKLSSVDKKQGLGKPETGDIEQLKAENAKLLKDNATLKTENENLKSKLTGLGEKSGEIKPAMDEIEKLKKENAKLLKENKDLNNEIGSLKEKGFGKDSKSIPGKQPDIEQIDKLKADNTKLMKDNDSLRNEIESLKSKLAGKGEKPGQLKTGVEDNEKLKADNTKLMKDNDSLRNEIESLKSKLAGKGEKPGQLKTGAEDNEKLKEENDKLKKEIKDLKHEIDRLKEQKGPAIEEKRVPGKQPDIEQSDKLKADNAKLMKDNDSLRNEIESLKSKLAGKGEKPGQLKTGAEDNEKLKEENDKLKKEIKDLKHEIDRLKEQKGPGIDEKRVPGKQPDMEQFDKLKADNAKLMKDNDSLRNENKKLKSTVPVSKTDDKPGQAAQLAGDTKLKEENSKLLKENEALKKEIQKLKSISPEIVGKLGETKSQMDGTMNLKTENNKLLKEIEALKDKLKQADGKTQRSDVSASKVAAESDSLPKDSKALTDKINALEKNNKDLKSKFDDLNKSFVSANNKKLECENENKKLQDLLKKAEEAGGLSENEMLNMYKNNADKLKSENEKLKVRISELEKELNSQRDMNRQMQQKYDSKKPVEGVIGKDVLSGKDQTKPKATATKRGEQESKREDEHIQQGDIKPDTRKDVVKSIPEKEKKRFSHREDVGVKSTSSDFQLSTKSKELKDKKIISAGKQDENDKIIEGVAPRSKSPLKPSSKQMELEYPTTQTTGTTGKVVQDTEPKHERRKREVSQDQIAKARKEPEDTKTKIGEQRAISPPDQSFTLEKDLDLTKTKKEKKIEESPFTKPIKDKELVSKEDKPEKFKTKKMYKEQAQDDEIPHKGIEDDYEKKIHPPTTKDKMPKGDSKIKTSAVTEIKTDDEKGKEKGSRDPGRVRKYNELPYEDDRDSDTEPIHKTNIVKGKVKDGRGKVDLEKSNKSKTVEQDQETQQSKMKSAALKGKQKESGNILPTDIEKEKKRISEEKKSKGHLISEIKHLDKSERAKEQFPVAGHEIKSFVDKDYDNELNQLKKKLYEAEKLINTLNEEINKLKGENEDLKEFKFPKDEIQEKYEELEKYLDGATKKLNKILQKAIRNGLKSLYLDELEFVHDALNTSMAQRQGRPPTPGHKSSEDLENIITVQEQRIESLMRRLDNYRQHSSDQEKRILDYSQKVQRFGTSVGLLDMKVESLQYENKQLRDLVSYEKEKSRKLEEILKSVLDNCKCTRKWVLQQNYPGLQKT